MRPRNREKFTIAIICALALESEAAEAYFDEVYDRFGTVYGKSKADRNCYLNGRIGKHEIVMCYMPGMGKGSAAMVASDLRHSYPNIEIALVLGICGGVPKSPNGQPIFLGDVIIGDSVILYDYGKQYPDGFRQKRDVKNILGGSSHKLRTLLTGLSVGQARRDFQDQMTKHHQRIQQADSRWHRPESDDVLFDSQYQHKHHTKSDSTYCACFAVNSSDQICDEATRNDCASLGCEQDRIIRRRQQTELNNAAVHIGKFASADRVMKSASHRDKLAEAEEVIAFEMESAGACDNFPCIVIKGVSDYADSHKDSKWQSYAAVNAAAAAKTLLKYLDPVAQKVRSSEWMVPFRRNPKFVGRQKEIEHLRALISDPNGPRELAITGLGGVGKTQVALEVAYQIRDDDPDCSIFWIPCTSLESVEQAYTEIAQRLELSGGNAKKEVQTYLSQSTSVNWLIIFDNVDDKNIWFGNDNALHTFIAENENGRTLFTSRNQQLALDLTDSNVLPLPEYDIHTGLEFLQQSLQKNDPLKHHDTAVQFLEQLMLLPLAITQAVAYINKNQISLSTYIGLLERQESDIIEVLSEDFKDKWRYKDIQNPVATTWWISFRQIQQSNQLAAEYLTFMACINPRNIPLCMLPPSSSENEKIKAIGLLKSYAFVSDCGAGQYGLLSIHRLVHIATRNWMRRQGIIDSQMIKALGILDKTLPHPQSLIPETWRIYVPHVLKVLKEESVRGKQIDHSTLIGAMSETLYQDWRYREAEDLCTRFIQNIDTPNFDDEGVWRTVTTLTSICRLRRFSETGRRVATQFLDSTKTIALQNLSCAKLRAISYLNLQQDDEAKKAILAVIEGLGPEHPATMEFQASIAVTYQNLKRYVDSEQTFLQVIETAKSILGPTHFFTLRYQEGLAMLYRKSGQYTEAENVYLRVMETSKTSLHPSCCHKLNYQFNLGSIYVDQKRYKKAEEIMIQVIESKQRVRGPKTSDIIMCFMSLAFLYIKWQRFDKAEEALMHLDEYRQNCPDFIIGSIVHLLITSLRTTVCLRKRLISVEKNVSGLDKKSIYMEKKGEELGDELIYREDGGADLDEILICMDKIAVNFYEQSTHMEKKIADFHEQLTHPEKTRADLEKKLTHLKKTRADMDEILTHMEKIKADWDEKVALFFEIRS